MASILSVFALSPLPALYVVTASQGSPILRGV